MMTPQVEWALGYAVRSSPAEGNPFREEWSGSVHETSWTPSNPFVMRGSLHDAESFLIKITPGAEGSGLTGLATKAHEQAGYDAIVATEGGEVVGMIPLVDVPVDSHLDPSSVASENYEIIPDNLKAIVDEENQSLLNQSSATETT